MRGGERETKESQEGVQRRRARVRVETGTGEVVKTLHMSGYMARRASSHGRVALVSGCSGDWPGCWDALRGCALLRALRQVTHVRRRGRLSADLDPIQIPHAVN